jgi:hypothetical protein
MEGVVPTMEVFDLANAEATDYRQGQLSTRLVATATGAILLTAVAARFYTRGSDWPWRFWFDCFGGAAGLYFVYLGLVRFGHGPKILELSSEGMRFRFEGGSDEWHPWNHKYFRMNLIQIRPNSGMARDPRLNYFTIVKFGLVPMRGYAITREVFDRILAEAGKHRLNIEDRSSSMNRYFNSEFSISAA